MKKSSKFRLKEKEIIFFNFFTAGSSLAVQAGLDPAAQPGYWPKLVTRFAVARMCELQCMLKQ